VKSLPILCLFGVLYLSLTPSMAQGQADLRLSLEQGDSAAATYDYTFPLMGKKVVERGFDIPYPFGISGNFLAQRFDVLIEDLQLSLGDAELVPIDIVEFESADSRMITGNVRGDLWVLPFLNVSVLYGDGTGRTSVALKEPIEFSTEVEYRGKYYGFGIMGAFGIDRYFFTVDWSQTWFDSDILDKPVLANIGGFRTGRTFDVKGKNLSVWVGTMYQNYESATLGTVSGEDIFSGGFQDELEGYEDAEWYQDLGRPQQLVVDELVAALLAGDPSQVKINYSINKRPAKPQNLLIGSRFEFNKTWEVRAEAGFIGREQMLVSLAYRWPW